MYTISSMSIREKAVRNGQGVGACTAWVSKPDERSIYVIMELLVPRYRYG